MLGSPALSVTWLSGCLLQRAPQGQDIHVLHYIAARMEAWGDPCLDAVPGETAREPSIRLGRKRNPSPPWPRQGCGSRSKEMSWSLKCGSRTVAGKNMQGRASCFSALARSSFGKHGGPHGRGSHRLAVQRWGGRRLVLARNKSSVLGMSRLGAL